MLFLAISNSVLGVESSLFPSNRCDQKQEQKKTPVPFPPKINKQDFELQKILVQPQEVLIQQNIGLQQQNIDLQLYAGYQKPQDLDEEERKDQGNPQNELITTLKNAIQQLEMAAKTHSIENIFYSNMLLNFTLEEFAQHCDNDWRTTLNMAYYLGIPRDFAGKSSLEKEQYN